MDISWLFGHQLFNDVKRIRGHNQLATRTLETARISQTRRIQSQWTLSPLKELDLKHKHTLSYTFTNRIKK
jgi:hypothetical protein